MEAGHGHNRCAVCNRNGEQRFLSIFRASLILILVLVLFFVLSSQLCGFQTSDLGLASEGVSWEGFRMEDSKFRV